MTTDAVPTPATPARADDLLPLDKVATMFPASGPKGHVSTATVFRWIISGKRHVKLKAVRKKTAGKSGYFVRPSDLERFRQAAGLAVAWLAGG